MKPLFLLTLVINLFPLILGQFENMDLRPMIGGPNGVGSIATMIDGFISTNASYCPQYFITAPTEPCYCINIHTNVKPPVTWLEASKYCYTKMDNRSVLLTTQTQSQFDSFSESLGSYAPNMGLVNVPIGVYLSDNKTVRSLLDQSVTDFSHFAGKCKFFVPDENVTTNASCLTLVSYVSCLIPCNSFNYPPPPNIAPGADRCNKSGFNASCETGWVNLGGVCYKNPVDSNTLLTYADASDKCQSIGGWLPSISNQQEWDALTNYVYNTGISGPDSFAAPMWLGGTLNGTTATWNDGTPWQFQYWAATEPKKTSSCMWWSVGHADFWSTGNCTQPAVVFCQKYPPCFTTTTTTTTTTPTTTTSTTTSTTTTSTTTTKPTTTTTTTTTKPTITSTTTTTYKTTLPTTTTTTATTKMLHSSSASTTEYEYDETTTEQVPSTSTTIKETTSSTSRLPSTSTSTSSTKLVTTPHMFRPISDCLSNPLSFIENGVCYEILTEPCPEDAHAGVIRSADIGEKLLQLYKQENPSSTAAMFWIGYQDNNASEYKFLNGSLTLDETYTLVVDVSASGKCPTFQWALTNPKFMLINSSTPCTTENELYFCETWPTFEQKACNQSLATTGVQAVTTTSVATALACTQQCTMEPWCLSVNYNPSEKSCQCVAADMTSKTLVCDLGWNYYEKI